MAVRAGGVVAAGGGAAARGRSATGGGGAAARGRTRGAGRGPIVDTVEELAFRSSELEVVVLPSVGGRLHRLRAFGRDLLRTPDDPRDHLREPFVWGAYPMAPWCNRIEPGPTIIGGRTIRLEANAPDGSALHGQVAAVPWEVLGDGSLRVRAGGDGWPWTYEVVERVEVDGPTVRLSLALTNLSDVSMPAGVGIHPWFRTPVEVAVPAAFVYPSNLSPSAAPIPVAGDLDLHRLAPPASGLDGTWTGLVEPAAGLRWPALGLAATLSVDTPTPCVVVATPIDREAIAIEPQTHAPQGIRRLLANEPDAMTMLEPGTSLVLGVSLAFHADEIRGEPGS